LDMGVHNGLTGGFAHVHAHVIPVRVQVRIQLRTDLPNQLKRGFALILGEIEEVGEMAKRDDQHVPFADGIPIIAGVAKGIPEDYFLGNWRAEWALGIHKGEGHEPGESVWEPIAGAVVVTVTVTLVAELPGVTGLGETVQVASEGAPMQMNVMGWFNPPSP